MEFRGKMIIGLSLHYLFIPWVIAAFYWQPKKLTFGKYTVLIGTINNGNLFWNRVDANISSIDFGSLA